MLWVVDCLPELPVFNKLPARKPIDDPSVFQNLRFYPGSFSLMLVSLQLQSSVKSEASLLSDVLEEAKPVYYRPSLALVKQHENTTRNIKNIYTIYL